MTFNSADLAALNLWLCHSNPGLLLLCHHPGRVGKDTQASQCHYPEATPSLPLTCHRPGLAGWVAPANFRRLRCRALCPVGREPDAGEQEPWAQHELWPQPVLGRQASQQPLCTGTTQARPMGRRATPFCSSRSNPMF